VILAGDQARGWRLVAIVAPAPAATLVTLAAVTTTVVVVVAMLAAALAGGGGRLDPKVAEADRPEGAACHQLRDRAAPGDRGQRLGQTIKP
jgi:hypothetical protein